MAAFKHHITSKLLNNIKEIAVLVQRLDSINLNQKNFIELESISRALSAYASTSIEGNPLPLTDVKKIIKSQPKNARESEIEVLNYNAALKFIHQELSTKKIKWNLKLVETIHALVVKNLLPKFQTGKIRKEPVFVNDPKARQTIYWPPDHADVPSLMKELLHFVEKNKNDMDAVLLAGIFHKQFVIIHPFLDGNGRTCRLLTTILLANLGINLFPLFSFENFYNNNITKYFSRVGLKGNYYDEYKNLDFTPWLEYFTDGILDELLRVQKEIQKKVSTPETELKKHDIKLINHIKNHGYITDAQYTKLVPRAKATRTLDFNRLMKLGLIERFGRGKNTHYKLKEE